MVVTTIFRAQNSARPTVCAHQCSDNSSQCVRRAQITAAPREAPNLLSTVPGRRHTEVAPVSRRAEPRRSRGEPSPTLEGSTHYPTNPQRSPFHRAAQLCLGSAVSAFGTP